MIEDIMTDKPSRCKICGFSTKVLVEIYEHMFTHKEFTDRIEDILPGFSERLKRR